MTAPDLPAAAVLRTARLVLEPLRVEHADEMAPLLDDESLHTWTGGRPASPGELAERYRRQVAGQSADGCEIWLNWVLRRTDDRRAAGYVQATVVDHVAEVAWVVGTEHQRQGFAREGATAVAGWLAGHGVRRLVAHVHPEHAASQQVAAFLGLAPTGEVLDGEQRWAGPVR